MPPSDTQLMIGGSSAQKASGSTRISPGGGGVQVPSVTLASEGPSPPIEVLQLQTERRASPRTEPMMLPSENSFQVRMQRL